MNITVYVHKDAFDLGIRHPAVCVIQNVRVLRNEGALDDEIAELMTVLSERPQTILSRSEVIGFRDLFAKMGYAKQVPAGQRLIESFQRRGFKKYNNLIDAYNIASRLARMRPWDARRVHA